MNGSSLFSAPVFRFLGSLKLAMILLAVLIMACIFGALVESRLDAAVAQAYIYDASWFIAWLLLLCVNLTVAVLVRWPLKPRHTGYVITHAGMVAILAGAIIGRIWGVEGMVTLSKGDPPTDHLLINQKLLYVQTSETDEGATCVLETNLRPPEPSRPVTLRLKDAIISAIGYAEELGALVRVERNGENSTQWVPMGATVHFDVAGGPVHVLFGHRSHPLNFSVALEDFEVERNEGTRNPSGFKSYVRFTDPVGNITACRDIWMNHPANFPDFPGAGWLGTAYKFSQASWNPNDLNQTTLQVIRDPGWPLKWLGSLMFCAGIFTMFYLNPYFRPQQNMRSKFQKMASGIHDKNCKVAGGRHQAPTTRTQVQTKIRI